jgi:pyruvate dehydrogenase E1 component beta subunit
MADRAMTAAERLEADGLSPEVIDVRWLRPLDVGTIGASFERTGRLLLVEEEVHAAGWAATVVSELAQRYNLVGRLDVISLPADLLLPYSPSLEDQLIPSADAIAASALRLVRR